MADVVEQALQDMVPELDDLRRKRIFKDLEIRQIVQRRREFEYAILEQDRKPLDYLNYVRYEIALECLRRRRSKALNWRSKSISDYAGLRRLITIFDRCTSKFRAEKRVWYQYIDFCLRSGSTKILSRVLLQAVKFHPREGRFWLLAADRELRCGHVRAARLLLTRGLRCVPRSAKLWGEFLRLEVQVACRLGAVRACTAAAGDPEGAAGTAAEGATGEPGGAATAEPTTSPWAPACLLLRKALGRLAKGPRSCTSFLCTASQCLERADRELVVREGFGELEQQFWAAVADHRPGATPRQGWEDVDAATAGQLWGLWWTHVRASGHTWHVVVDEAIDLAPEVVLQHLAGELARVAKIGDESGAPQAALLELAKASRTAADADTALAVLQALETCSPVAEKAGLAPPSRDLLKKAAKLHPSCTRLAALAWRWLPADGHARDAECAAVLASGARNLESAEAAQLLLLMLDAQAQEIEPTAATGAGHSTSAPAPVAAAALPRRARLLETLLSRLAQGASPRPLLEAFLAKALADGTATLRAAGDEVQQVAALLWDLPALRATVLAVALEVELRVHSVPSGATVHRLSGRFEEVLAALDRGGEKDRAVEWWLRYGEFMEQAARWGCSEHGPRPMDLHWRALRSVADQASYVEQAQRRLQVSAV